MATMTTSVEKGEEHFGYVVFIAAAAAIIYACFAFLSIPFILRFVKEMKGKSLGEMG